MIIPEIRTVKAAHGFRDMLRQQQNALPLCKIRLRFGKAVRRADLRHRRDRREQRQRPVIRDAGIRQLECQLCRADAVRRDLNRLLPQRQIAGAGCGNRSGQRRDLHIAAGQRNAVGLLRDRRPADAQRKRQRECIARRIHKGIKPRQRHQIAAEAPPLLRPDEALVFAECIEHSDKRRSLSWEILQIEQLESREMR